MRPFKAASKALYETSAITLDSSSDARATSHAHCHTRTLTCFAFFLEDLTGKQRLLAVYRFVRSHRLYYRRISLMNEYEISFLWKTCIALVMGRKIRDVFSYSDYLLFVFVNRKNHQVPTKGQELHAGLIECVHCHAIKNKIKNNAVAKAKNCDITECNL